MQLPADRTQVDWLVIFSRLICADGAQTGGKCQAIRMIFGQRNVVCMDTAGANHVTHIQHLGKTH